MSKAVYLNNRAVEMMQEQGPHRQAVKLLRMALSTLRTGENDVVEQRLRHYNDSKQYPPPHAMIDLDFVPVSISRQGGTANLHQDISHNSATLLPIYDRAIRLAVVDSVGVVGRNSSALDHTQDSSDDTHRRTLLAVVVYNTSLFHHLQGVRQGRSSTLLNSLEFYQMTLDAVSGIVSGGSRYSATLSSATQLNLLYAVIQYNMAQIHSELASFAEMQRYLQSLMSVLDEQEEEEKAMATESSSVADCTGTDKEFDLLRLHSLFLQHGEELLLAPAA